MEKLRVVQYGTWLYTHAGHTMQAMRALPEYYEVVGVCEPNPERRARAEKDPAYAGLRWMDEEEILRERPDAVIVETKETEQAADALRFVRAGFAVHADKPCGGSISDFEALTAEVRARKTPFQVGYMYRFNPAVRRVLDMARSGELGQILSVELQMSQCYHGDLLRSLADLPGGMMFYLGCHLVDLMVLLQGEPQEVIPFNCATGIEESDLKDFGFAVLKYEHGVSFIKSVACEVSADARRQLVVSGTKGTVEIKPLEIPIDQPGLFCANRVGLRYTRAGWHGSFDSRAETVEYPPFGRYDDMMIDFARVVRGEKENEFPLEHEERVYRLTAKICGVEA